MFGVLREIDTEKESIRHLITISFLAFSTGCVYWLKYSQFVYACSLAFFLGLMKMFQFLKKRSYFNFVAVVLPSVLFFIPFLLLIYSHNQSQGSSALNYTEVGGNLNDYSFIKDVYGEYYLEASRSVLLPISILGGIGSLLMGTGIYGEIATFINNYTILGNIESLYHLNGYVFLQQFLELFLQR